MSSAVTWVFRQVDVTAWTMISSSGWPIFLCKRMTQRMVLCGSRWRHALRVEGCGCWVCGLASMVEGSGSTHHMEDWGCTTSAIFSHAFDVVLSCGITYALAHQDDSAQPANFGSWAAYYASGPGVDLVGFIGREDVRTPQWYFFSLFLSIDGCLLNEEI